MNLRLTCFFFVLCWLVPNTAYPLARPETIRPPQPTLVYSPKNTDILIFQGTVEQRGGGTALRTETAVYPLLGGDFAMIVGEKVKIIGKVVRENEEAKIMVARVQFPRREHLAPPLARP